MLMVYFPSIPTRQEILTVRMVHIHYFPTLMASLIYPLEHLLCSLTQLVVTTQLMALNLFILTLSDPTTLQMALLLFIAT